MFFYVTLILTTVIALLGILVKTKEDSKSSKYYKLTKWGWILLTIIILLLFFNLISQYQKDRIQKLQELSSLQKKKSDSIIQTYQKKYLELLLQKQIQKTQIDSMHFIQQISKTDSLMKNQGLSLSEQRLTIYEQRNNNDYLRSELRKQVKVNDALTYPMDSLWLNAAIDIELTDSLTDVLKAKEKGKNYLDNLFYDRDEYFSNAAYKFSPGLYKLIKDIRIGIISEDNDFAYEFSLNRYVDTTANSHPFNSIYRVRPNLPSYVELSYNYSNGKLILHLNNIKCSFIRKSYLSSLNNLCKTNAYFNLEFYEKNTKSFIKSSSIVAATIFLSATQYINFEKFSSLSASLVSETYYDGINLHDEVIVQSKCRGKCVFY